MKASREHRVTVEANGVVRIGGGKYTTYRVMARDVIDAVLGTTRPRDARAIPPNDGSSAPPTPIALARIAAELATIPAIAAVGPDAAARLVSRHGTEAPGVVALGAELDLIRPLVPGRPFLEAEVTWAARHELALVPRRHVGAPDRLAQELPDRGAAIAPRVAELLGTELGWGETRRAREVEAYLEMARREYSGPAAGRAGPTAFA